ncbi:adenosylcobinamide amidohydrolase [Ectobacillus panaciterrae]|uniref:adenosylcobinamide amidohydrolase n=1 Tax=Ectobacillus panaciterrae TaxID=363872 RepID=UPI0003F543F7|nr:adenosylcobinamide amidohydrolase [Ectobacillus panaciterrae]
MLSVQHVTGGYAEESVLHDISFDVEMGEILGILGPNGSGKTTLLKMLSGVLPYERGSIAIKERALSGYSPKQLAKVVAVLPQHQSQAFSYTVKETVSLGRYAHQKSWLHTWSEEDEEAVQRVMNQTGISSFQHQFIHELSGGERQRVFLAQALAQEPEILLLDEPTNHLDLSFQKELLDSLQRWTDEYGLTVISIFHDLNLAGLYCDKLLLLQDGMINMYGNVNEVLREERIKTVYRTNIKKHAHSKVPKPQMLLLPEEQDERHIRIDESLLNISSEIISLQSPAPLRTLSSAVIGSGTGWHQTFVNRHVHLGYDCDNHRDEMTAYLKAKGYEPEETVGMMTAAALKDVSFRLYEQDGFSVFIVVTAGLTNAVDASRSECHVFKADPGTINTWVFVNGELTEEALVQSIVTAAEAKTKALHDQQVTDSVTGTLATGTSTDSILIAATQRGKLLEFAGSIAPLGKLIGKGIYECTTDGVRKYKKRMQT